MKDWLISLTMKATPNIDECISMLGEHFEWLLDLKKTEQDPEWHAEGDVHIHTDMVLTELYLLMDEITLSGAERQSLILSALLHDIGKTVCTKRVLKEGVERVRSPKHENHGRSYLSFKLIALDLPFEVVWTILNLVGEHDKPKLMSIKNLDQHHYFKTARQSNLKLLYLLEVADMKGRTCNDLAKQMGFLEEFKMFSEEHGIWDSQRSVKNELSMYLSGVSESTQHYIHCKAVHQLESGRINLASEAIGTTYEHRNDHPHLIVLCGPSGLGKSSWITKNYPGYDVVSLDELRAELNGSRESQKNKGKVLQESKERVKQSLRKRAGIIFDATNLRKDFRASLFRLGEDYHALVTLIFFMSPEEVIRKNNKNRKCVVPEKIIDKQIRNFEFPLLEESHEFKVIGESGKLLFSSPL